MNQSLLNSSSNRHNRKRNSHESLKASFTFKNPKKSLPQVSIDLNQQNKKTKLAIQQRNSKMEELFNEKQFVREPSKMGKSCKKKDQLVLNYLYNTQKMVAIDQKKNILNEYRDQIELLKLQNEKLKEENERLRSNEEYLSRRLNEYKAQSLKSQSQLKQYATSLEIKLQKHSKKIKDLFQELIKIKKTRISDQQSKYYDKTTHSGHTNNDLYKYKNVRQPYTYRFKENNIEASRWKRMTSPSSHDREKVNWAEEQIENLVEFERRGEEAFYRLQKGLQGTFHSDYN